MFKLLGPYKYYYKLQKNFVKLTFAVRRKQLVHLKPIFI